MNELKKLVCILLSLIGMHTIQAEIITYPAEVTPGSWLCFRKEISVEKDASHNLLKIAADSKYWLWINGELVVREGGLKRGPNPKDTYCDILQDVKLLFWSGISEKRDLVIEIVRRQEFL